MLKKITINYCRSKNCEGYVMGKLKSTPGPQRKFCFMCKKLKKKKLKQKSRKRKVEQKRKLLRKKMREKYIGLHRKNATLQKKVK